jgi:hypothetical protein
MGKQDTKSEAVKTGATTNSGEPRKYKPFAGIKKPDVKVLKPGTLSATEAFRRLRGR